MDYEETGGNICGNGMNNQVVLKGICPFCNLAATFRQLAANNRNNDRPGTMAALKCEGCNSIFSYNRYEQKVYPAPKIQGVQNLPEGIAKYYNEALTCLSANAPNGAATMFRKTIHAIGIHYKVAEVNDRANLYEIINKLNEDGHIVVKIKDALLKVKDIGNDGAHVNNNEPDMEQALCLKELIDVVLNSTVNCDKAIEYAENKHKCNP
jgi:hypothetical protein